MSAAPLITIAVVSDTHIPDRAPALPEGLLEALSAAGVEQILHAGDVCAPRVLAQLKEVAPVLAARGNRDFVFSPSLPLVVDVELAGVKISLQHGHGGMRSYWADKFAYVYEGYRLERYWRRLTAVSPDAKVYIFGHTHRPENVWRDGRLLFNPGAMVGIKLGNLMIPPSYGLLRIYEQGRLEAETIQHGTIPERRRYD
jgi:putative phosphoesterase